MLRAHPVHAAHTATSDRSLFLKVAPVQAEDTKQSRRCCLLFTVALLRCVACRVVVPISVGSLLVVGLGMLMLHAAALARLPPFRWALTQGGWVSAIAWFPAAAQAAVAAQHGMGACQAAQRQAGSSIFDFEAAQAGPLLLCFYLAEVVAPALVRLGVLTRDEQRYLQVMRGMRITKVGRGTKGAWANYP